jgi:hypothetical protein
MAVAIAFLMVHTLAGALSWFAPTATTSAIEQEVRSTPYD